MAAGGRGPGEAMAMAGNAVVGGIPAQAFHHASQAAEQALKAILIRLDREPRQTPLS